MLFKFTTFAASVTLPGVECIHHEEGTCSLAQAVPGRSDAILDCKRFTGKFKLTASVEINGMTKQCVVSPSVDTNGEVALVLDLTEEVHPSNPDNEPANPEGNDMSSTESGTECAEKEEDPNHYSTMTNSQLKTLYKKRFNKQRIPKGHKNLDIIAALVAYDAKASSDTADKPSIASTGEEGLATKTASNGKENSNKTNVSSRPSSRRAGPR